MNQYRCETCKKECKITVVDADDGKPVSFNPKDPIESTEWFVQGISQVGCASHSDQSPHISSSDEWKRREERKHQHDHISWVNGWISGFLTSRKFVQEKVAELRQNSGSHCDKCDHWDCCEGCPYTDERTINYPQSG
jgi:hypothetical protein